MDAQFYSAISDDWDGTIGMESNSIHGKQSDRSQSDSPKAAQFVFIISGVVLIAYLSNLIGFQTAMIVGISVLFTWFHIWLALKMCFYPLTFCGIGIGRIRLGWEGIVPSKAWRMAHKSCDLMIDKLIIVDDLIDSVKGHEVFQFLKTLGYVDQINNKVLASVSQKYLPNRFVPDLIKRQIFASIEDASYSATVRFVHAMTARLKDRSFFDIRDLIVSRFVSDKGLLVGLFTTTGQAELSFIEVSGALMGLFCGIAQVFILHIIPIHYNPYLVFALANFFIGYMTNWIALFIIFNPIEPVRITPSFELHGLFLRRQVEASKVYARSVTDSVLNMDQIVQFLQTYPRKWQEIKSLFIDSLGQTIQETLPRLPFGRPDLIEFLSESVLDEVEKNPQIFQSLVQFIQLKLNLYEIVSRNLMALPSRDFEQMLHPVFQEDEWLLTLIGGVLGALVGILQVFMFHL
jgi:uncharacterized membrane protein YheB (UPF0754 family)